MTIKKKKKKQEKLHLSRFIRVGTYIQRARCQLTARVLLLVFDTRARDERFFFKYFFFLLSLTLSLSSAQKTLITLKIFFFRRVYATRVITPTRTNIRRNKKKKKKCTRIAHTHRNSATYTRANAILYNTFI